MIAVLVARLAAADAPSGYKCGPGGRAIKGTGCKCPAEKLATRDADNAAICAPKPEPQPSACLADRKGKHVVKIDSSPQGATIFLGDKACGSVGLTPWSGKLAVGPVIVMLERLSFEPYSRSITVSGVARQELSIPLTRTNVGSVDVRADADPNVAGAAISIDGQQHGVVPVVLQVPGGRHRIEIAKDGFEPFLQWIDVQDSQTVMVMPALKAAVVVKGRLVVDADLAGAEVWVNGVKRGVTPLALTELALGTYHVEVRKLGATTWKQTVEVTKAQTLVRATLVASVAKPTAGIVKVTSAVPGGEVFLDGNAIGKVPLEQPLPPGDYWLVVKLPGHKRFEQKLHLELGQTIAVVADLRPAAELRVLSTPAGSTVFVDGIRVGATPLVIDLELGDHVIYIERSGFQRHDERVKLIGPTVTVSATLKR